MIVCIEGADGSGKSVVAHEVGKALGGCDVISFPNDAARTGPLIRSYLRREWVIADRLGERLGGGPVNDHAAGALAFQALQIANRMELMPRLLDAKKRNIDLVLCRYQQSAWVYGQLDGLPRDWLELVHEAMVQPDANILLDASPKTCVDRRQARDGVTAPERYEGRLELVGQIVASYRDLWRAAIDRRKASESWFIVDAERPLDEVIASVLGAIEEARR